MMAFKCSGTTTVSIDRNITEHKHAIADIATCKFDEITASGDSQGNVICWNKQCKNVTKRIHCGGGFAITCLNVLRKQVLVGSVQGMVNIYAMQSGQLMASVSAHTRPVTSISVAPESAYHGVLINLLEVLCAGEDTAVRVFKLHTRKPEAYQLEFRYGDEIQDKMLVGAQFANDRGSSMVFAAYDVPQLLVYKIYKKAIRDAPTVIAAKAEG